MLNVDGSGFVIWSYTPIAHWKEMTTSFFVAKKKDQGPNRTKEKWKKSRGLQSEKLPVNLFGTKD